MDFPVLSVNHLTWMVGQDLPLRSRHSFAHSPPAIHGGSLVSSFPLKNLESVSGHRAGIEPGNSEEQRPPVEIYQVSLDRRT